MVLRDYIDSPCGLRFMIDQLQLMSSCGRKRLLSTELMVDRGELQECFSNLKETYSILYEKSAPIVSATLASVKHRLMCLRDIDGTLSRLSGKVILDDIDLFEVKYLALLNNAVKEDVKTLGIKGVVLPDLEKVIAILDPEGVRAESFYVYDIYSKELTNIRKELREIKMRQAKEGGAVTSDRELELLGKEKLVEGQIREELSNKLRGYSSLLSDSLASLSDLDILLAKCLMIKSLGLCFPEISSDGRTAYKGMFHPYIVHIYNQKALGGTPKEFTPIDIEFSLECISIIGANMGGKTVVLKMLALNQLLFQFGFAVPARIAEIDIKEGVEVCIENEEDMSRGYSSFAAEVKAIDKVISRALAGERILAVVDEPARTTNPIEGTALVGALLNMLKERKLSLILTTHYNVKGDFFRRFRVNGLKEGKMDYRLRETSVEDVPHEAINVARSLKVNSEWIDLAQRELENN